MKILCTFPGRFGDLLWALPTIRALSESYGQPVDLLICGEFAGLVPLLIQQPYLASVTADPGWGLGAGWQPPVVWEEADRIFHLGYRRWPELPLPLEIDQTVRVDRELAPLDLTRPWITTRIPAQTPRREVAVGWSDCHFELKVGLLELLFTNWTGPKGSAFILPPAGSRWVTEQRYTPTDWRQAAQRIANTQVFLGDCSALHVLAVALGKPCVLVEPMEARWNPIFYPCGKTGPQVTLVTGLDGQPTFDARHCAEALQAALERSDGR